MDPLSIAAGAASLAVSATTISVSLRKVIREVKDVDAKVVALSIEVTRLVSLLKSVERTVRECHTVSLSLAHLDEDMWQQIDNALVDCKLTVEELSRVTMKISGEHSADAKALAKLFNKPSMHFRLTLHGDEVSDLARKIYKSNCSMQTAFAVLNVSLTFRTHVSQETLFGELRNLKHLVEESLKAAAQQHDEHSDHFATRQSRNLQNLAKAAQEFHVAASSTASTRYSFLWEGSEAGDLTLAQRERIELWNDFQTGDRLDNVTDKEMSTRTSNPRLDANGPSGPPPEPGRGKGATRETGQVDDDDDDESSSGSDLESDFLKNFEALAYTSFSNQNYSKAEQLLRMAVERSTGERSDAADFKLLKLKLALCCCLQGKWDHAAGIVESLSKSRTASNLPIFHLQQAISLAHLEGNRFEDAYNVCKTALNGKKRILGRTSADYYGCLTVFAAICEKRGSALEAEAVRHSIPEGWLPQSSIAALSPKQYILQHETLIGSVFSEETTSDSGPLSTRPGNPAPPDTAQTGTVSEHWSTLIPSRQRDGVQTAERDEKSGVAIEATDTGKESLPHSMTKPPSSPLPVPERNPAAQTPQDTNISLVQENADIPDRQSQVDVPQSHQPAVISASFPSETQQEYLPGHQQNPSIEIQRPNAPVQETDAWKPPGVGTHRLLPGAPSDGEGQTPSDQRYLTPAPDLNAQRSATPSPSQDDGRARSRRAFIEEIGTDRDAEYVSTLQALPPSPGGPPKFLLGKEILLSMSRNSTPLVAGSAASYIRLVSPPVSRTPSPNQPRTRWIVPRDISNVGCNRPFGFAGPPQVMFSAHATRASKAFVEAYRSVGVALRLGGSDAFTISDRSHQTVVCEVPCEPEQVQERESSSGVFGMRRLIRRVRSNVGRRGSDTGTVNVFHPRLWSKDPVDISESGAASAHHALCPDLHLGTSMGEQLHQMELAIADHIRRDHVETPVAAALRVDAVVCTLPDMMLDPRGWLATSETLASCPLLQHAKVLPHSLAVMQYFLDVGALAPPPNPAIASHVLVLTCDDLLAECTPYTLWQAASPHHWHVEVAEFDMLYMAELAGTSHVAGLVSELVGHKVDTMNSQFKHKMAQATVDDIVQRCCCQWHRTVLPEFRNDGEPWIVSYDMPPEFPAFRHGQLELKNDEILSSFRPSISLIRKMVLFSVRRMRDAQGIQPSHVLLAGSYARSRFLRDNISEALEDDSRLSGNLPPTLLYAADGQDAFALGALSHARGC